METEKCRSEEMDVGLPPMTIDSISQMIYRKTVMNEQSSRQEPITIFHDGRVYVFDVLELQVRAIILFAAGEMEGGMTSSSCKEAVTLALQSQILGPRCGSVKKSLRTFLQKRKNQASDPYSCSSSSTGIIDSLALGI